MGIIGRFAPTPSGRMHLGNVSTALLAWLSVRSQGGKMLLRIEDLDTMRCPRENEDRLREDLEWLGLDWDMEQPRQSERTTYYESVLSKLAQTGRVFPCWCTRGDLKNAPNAPHASDGHPIYPGTCRELTEGQRAKKAAERPPLWRLQVPEETISFIDGHFGPYTENLAAECGDFILRRADGVFAYQLAVVADDIDAGVTEVVRGRDLISSTPRQLYLYRLLEAPAPRYCHVPLLTSRDGRRLSKRDRDLDLGVLRQRYSAAEIIGALGHAAGLTEEYAPCTPAELACRFDWNKVPKGDLIVTLPGR